MLLPCLYEIITYETLNLHNDSAQIMLHANQASTYFDTLSRTKSDPNAFRKQNLYR